MQLFDDIRTIASNQLQLLYQPIVCVNSGRCAGLKALLRIRKKMASCYHPHLWILLNNQV
tara:strand:+ start:535 stop:714 length:180 start_codon:yes stop_codon:yes gene_type:complete